MAMYERDIVATLRNRIAEERRFIQIVIGPRQTGKSTAVAQALGDLDVPVVAFSFDRPRDQRARRLEELWGQARQMLDGSDEVVVSLDEIQKVPDWSSTVKFLWDEDTLQGRNVKAILTGSSAMSQPGATAGTALTRSN